MKFDKKKKRPWNSGCLTLNCSVCRFLILFEILMVVVAFKRGKKSDGCSFHFSRLDSYPISRYLEFNFVRMFKICPPDTRVSEF